MRPTRPATRARVTLELAAALLATGLAACIPTAHDLPDGAEALPCLGPSCVPLDGGAPVTTAPLVDCQATENGLDFLTVLDNQTGTAQYFYQYVDGTSGLSPSGYSPPAILQDRCQNVPAGSNPAGTNYVYHTSGGPFLGWGGGLGIAIQHLNATACVAPGNPSYCPNAATDPDPTVSENASAVTAINFAAFDVSQYDGISLWARRGPNSQPLLRVLVGDRYTDDDISFLMYLNNPSDPRYCERKAECTCLFQDTTCSFFSANPADDPVYSAIVIPDPNNPDPLDPTGPAGALYCGAPGELPAAASQQPFTGNLFEDCGPMMNGTSCAANFCGNSLCDQPYAAYASDGPDRQFANKPCTPYTYRSGVQASVCYDPKTDPPPPEADEQCGDHFTFPIDLSTEWQFYKIPFTEMFQQGWAKQAKSFDLKSVSVVRFTWDVGYIDYYIDDVKFYRNAPADGGASQ